MQQPEQSQQSPQPQSQPSPQQSLQAAEQAVASRASKNPFSASNIAEKRKAVVESLRRERNVEPPKEQTATQTQSTVQSESTPAPTPAERDILAEHESKLRAIMATEASIESKRADAERLDKEAAEKLAKIESAKSDPLEFLAQVGITESDFQKYLAETTDTPELQRIKAVEKRAAEQIEALTKQFETYKAEQTAAREQEQQQSRLSQAAQLLQSDEYRLTAKIGNAEQVLRRQQEIEQHTGQKVSLADAAKHLEQGFRDNLRQILDDKDIRAMFATQPQSGSTAESYTPTTLNSAFSSSTEPGEGVPAPRDWEAKKKIAVANLARLRELQQRL